MKLFNFVKQTFKEFFRDKAGQMSGAFAYTTIFAIGPLLLVLISIVGFVYGEQAVSGQLYSRLSEVVGVDAATTIQNLVASIHKSHSGTVAFVIGVVGALLAAISLTAQLQNSFDAIFSVVPDPKRGVKKTIYIKLKNLAILVIAGLILIGSITLSTIVAGLGQRAQDRLGVSFYAAEPIDSLISLAVFATLLYLIYGALTNVHIPRKIVLVTSLVISSAFLVGKTILGFVITNNSSASAYGAAASLVVLLLWFYYTAQILIMGAEGMKVYGLNRDLTYKPKNFYLKRRSFDIDTDNDFMGKLIDAFYKAIRDKSRK